MVVETESRPCLVIDGPYAGAKAVEIPPTFRPDLPFRRYRVIDGEWAGRHLTLLRRRVRPIREMKSMTKIYKYPFVIDDRVSLEMPEGAKVLSVQYQHSTPCIWAMVDTLRPSKVRRFRVFGTGHDLPRAGLAFIGTIQDEPVGLVWHVFEDTGGGA